MRRRQDWRCTCIQKLMAAELPTLKHHYRSFTVAANSGDHSRVLRNCMDPFLGKIDAVLAREMAFTDSPVLIQGETGTGIIEEYWPAGCITRRPRTHEPVCSGYG